MTTIKKEAGFTLIEVMVALTTMAIAFLAVCALHLSSYRTDIRNRDESQALYLANQKVEELRSRTFSNVVNGEDFSAYPFAVEWTVTTPQVWRKDVLITVSWNEKISFLDGTRPEPGDDPFNRSIQVTTIIADLE